VIPRQMRDSLHLAQAASYLEASWPARARICRHSSSSELAMARAPTSVR
jgi:hypothetical protein